MNISFTLQDIEKIISDVLFCKGELTSPIVRIASLSDAQSGDLSFLSNAKYASQVSSSKASLILLPKSYLGDPMPGQLFMFVDNPSHSLGKVCRYLEQQLWPRPEQGIHPTAFVDDSARVDATATIGPFVYIGANTVIGKHVVINSHSHIGKNVTIDESSWIMPHVSILDYCRIGKRVRLHSMVVVGSDGFGYSTLKDGTHQSEPQVGIVVIEDDVDIGAGTTIDRARFNITRIGTGTKIDNLVQIAHNVCIGKHCLIVAQAGIAGSTIVEDHVVIGGQAGISGHLHIGKGSMIGAQTGLGHDLAPRSYVRGEQGYPYMLAQKIDILKKRLPELFKRVDKIEETLGVCQSK